MGAEVVTGGSVGAAVEIGGAVICAGGSVGGRVEAGTSPVSGVGSAVIKLGEALGSSETGAGVIGADVTGEGVGSSVGSPVGIGQKIVSFGIPCSKGRKA